MTVVRPPSGATRRNIAGTAVVLLAVVAWLVVRSLDRSSSQEPATGVLSASCEVLDQARTDEREAAKATFLDHAHEPIHDLARRASDDGHRREAARLLEAKNVVESASLGPTPAAARRLVAATRAALAALGEPTTPCPQR